LNKYLVASKMNNYNNNKLKNGIIILKLYSYCQKKVEKAVCSIAKLYIFNKTQKVKCCY